MKDNLRAITRTLFQAEQESFENESTTLQTEIKLQLETFFQKDHKRHHIPKEASNREVHFVCLLMNPCFSLFRNSRTSIDKSIGKLFSGTSHVEKIYCLQIALVVLVRKNTLIYQLWGKEWNHPIFGSTIIGDRYKGVDDAFEV